MFWCLRLVRSEKLRRSHAAFQSVTKENVAEYFPLFSPHLLVREAKESGAISVNPVDTQLAGELGTLVLEHLVTTREDSNKFGLICHCLTDQAIITRNPAIHQVVIFDMVMNSSAFRLSELEDCRIFELNANTVVMDEKEQLLRKIGAKLLAKERHTVHDRFMTEGWHRPLLINGFDPAQPTLWILGSMLSYLPSVDADRAVTALELLSAPGSQICADMFAGHKVELTDNCDSFFEVDCLCSSGIQGKSAQVFRKMSGWNVELLARRDDDLNYYGTMWDAEKFDNLRVQDPKKAYLGPWYIARFSKPEDSN